MRRPSGDAPYAPSADGAADRAADRATESSSSCHRNLVSTRLPPAHMHAHLVLTHTYTV